MSLNVIDDCPSSGKNTHGVAAPSGPISNNPFRMRALGCAVGTDEIGEADGTTLLEVEVDEDSDDGLLLRGSIVATEVHWKPLEVRVDVEKIDHTLLRGTRLDEVVVETQSEDVGHLQEELEGTSTDELLRSEGLDEDTARRIFDVADVDELEVEALVLLGLRMDETSDSFLAFQTSGI